MQVESYAQTHRTGVTLSNYYFPHYNTNVGGTSKARQFLCCWPQEPKVLIRLYVD